MSWRENRSMLRVRAVLPAIFLLCALPGLVGWVSGTTNYLFGAQDQPIEAGKDSPAILHRDILMQTTTVTPGPTPTTTATPAPAVPKSASTAGLVCGAVVIVLIIIGGVGWSAYWKRTLLARS